MAYTPNQNILDNYAEVLINFALNDCKGVNKGEVVLLQVPECAKPLLISLRRKVLEAGAHPIIKYQPDDIGREFFDLANDEQLEYFPKNYLKGLIDEVDHLVGIVADTNPKELEGVSPKKIMQRSKVFKPYMDWRNEKEQEGRFTWTMGLYGTQAMADEAGMSIEEYWDEIIKACYLDYENPVGEWRKITEEIERVKDNLNSLDIVDLHVESEGVDLHIGLDENRKWLGGSGRNIPSYEVFISPNKWKTQGYIQFNQPLYRYGSLIKDVYLEFVDGRVVKSTASQGEEMLHEMINAEGADMVGEFSLTDSRLSRITKFMAETLYDENVGGEQGNTHIALGNAYKDSYPGDCLNVSESEWSEMGYNESVVHTDIISTKKRTVTATLSSGEKKIIYDNGQFLI